MSATVKFEDALEALKSGQVWDAMGAAVEAQNNLVVAELRRGVPGLARRSGRLTESYRSLGARATPDRITTWIENTAPYAAAHEFGVEKTVTVRAFERVTPSGTRSTVRAHTMRMSLPALHMLERAMNERSEQYLQGVAAAAVRAVK